MLCMMNEGRREEGGQLLFASLFSLPFSISLGGMNSDSSALLPPSLLPPSLPLLDPAIPSASSLSVRASSLRSRFVISAVDSNLLSSSSSTAAAAHMMVSRQKMGSESRGIADIKPRLIGEIDNEKREGRDQQISFKKGQPARYKVEQTMSNSNTERRENWRRTNQRVHFTGAIHPDSAPGLLPVPA